MQSTLRGNTRPTRHRSDDDNGKKHIAEGQMNELARETCWDQKTREMITMLGPLIDANGEALWCLNPAYPAQKFTVEEAIREWGNNLEIFVCVLTILDQYKQCLQQLSEDSRIISELQKRLNAR